MLYSSHGGSGRPPGGGTATVLDPVYSMSTAMKHPGPLRPSSLRLFLLVGLLALAAAGLAAELAWFSPDARERRLAATPLDRLEKRAADSRDPLLFYYLARARSE